jgi:cytochrome c553
MIAGILRLSVVVGLVAFGAGPVAADTVQEKAAVCEACHGENGVPINKTIPNIFGQNEGYIYIELRDMQKGTRKNDQMKKGARKNDQMAPIVENLSREDMFALAAYFAAKPWPYLQQPRASAADANHFASMAASAGCVGCHQAGYIGAGTQPRLAGQGADYLAKTMLDFRTGARGNNTWMTDLLKTYSEDDISQMARVLGGM